MSNLFGLVAIFDCFQGNGRWKLQNSMFVNDINYNTELWSKKKKKKKNPLWCLALNFKNTFIVNVRFENMDELEL